MAAPVEGDGKDDPVEEARRLDAIEDQMDIEEALARLADGQEPVSYESVREQLGLT